MRKYRVTGTITLEVQAEIEADSPAAARMAALLEARSATTAGQVADWDLEVEAE